jgi:hypothetical protein
MAPTMDRRRLPDVDVVVLAVAKTVAVPRRLATPHLVTTP